MVPAKALVMQPFDRPSCLTVYYLPTSPKPVAGHCLTLKMITIMKVIDAFCNDTSLVNTITPENHALPPTSFKQPKLVSTYGMVSLKQMEVP